jgi:hypothetical protein
MEGEELLTEYGPTVEMNRDQRQTFLREQYNFECKCSACTLPKDESLRLDQQLAILGEMNKKVELGTSGDGLETTRLINRILKLTEDEGIPSG